MGLPSDVFASRMSFLPIFLRNFFAGILANLTNGNNSKYGLPEPKHKFGETHPTINSELLYKIRHGKINPKLEIDYFLCKFFWEGHMNIPHIDIFHMNNIIMDNV